jgi:hypothetical protein
MHSAYSSACAGTRAVALNGCEINTVVSEGIDAPRPREVTTAIAVRGQLN